MCQQPVEAHDLPGQALENASAPYRLTNPGYSLLKRSSKRPKLYFSCAKRCSNDGLRCSLNTTIIMVLSILVAIIAAPALLASQESIRQSQGKEKREEHRARRCNLIATCVKSSMRSRELNGRPIVLRDGKVWIPILCSWTLANYS